MKTTKIIILSMVLLLSFSLTGFADNIRPVDFPDPSSPGEDSLQQIFDNIVYSPFSIDAVDDQSPVSLWQKSEGIIDSYAITMFTAASGSLGIWSPFTTDEIVLTDLTKPADSDEGGVGGGNVQIGFEISDSGVLKFDEDGNNNIENDEYFSGFGSFGFYWEVGDNKYYTLDEKNTGDSGLVYADNTPDIDDNPPAPLTRALVYGLEEGLQLDRNYYGVLDDYSDPNNPIIWGSETFTASNPGYMNDWIIAFEDGTDGDANDAVFLMEDMKPVPEPATILLFGAGLLGLAAYGRKKGLGRA
jgi:hypothetical protein